MLLFCVFSEWETHLDCVPTHRLSETHGVKQTHSDHAVKGCCQGFSAHTAEWKHYLGDKAWLLFLHPLLSLSLSLLFTVLPNIHLLPLSPVNLLLHRACRSSLVSILVYCSLPLSWANVILSAGCRVSPAASFSSCNPAERLMSGCMQSDGGLQREWVSGGELRCEQGRREGGNSLKD